MDARRHLDKVEEALKHGIVGISRRVCILQNRKNPSDARSESIRRIFSCHSGSTAYSGLYSTKASIAS